MFRTPPSPNGRRARRFASRLACGAPLAIVLATACTGAIPDETEPEPGAGGKGSAGIRAGRGGSSATGGAGGATETPNAGIELSCNRSGPAAGVAPLRRLTTQQYRNTLRDLFAGIATPPDVDLPAQNVVGGYDNNAAGQTPSLALLEAYHESASKLAAAAVTPANLSKLAPCASGANEDMCGQQFVTTWGKKIFRRPLATEEATRLVNVFKGTRATDGYQAAITDTLQAMLMAPQFLHVVETGGTTKDGFVALDHHQVAARLSYLLWNTTPDATLTAAADANQLGDADAIGKQVDRLLGDDRAKSIVAEFQHQWLKLDKLDKLDKSSTMFPKWNADVATSLRTSVERYVDHAFWNVGKLPAMLTDTHAFVDDKTAWIWGVGNAPATMGLVDVGAGKRAGLLTQAGVMAAFAKTMTDSPVFRGLYVMRQFLCQDVGDPPDNVPALSEEPAAGDGPMTMRQRQEKSHAAPTCASCHKMIDGIGFAFGNYDAAGAWRDKDNGIAVNAAGELVNTRDANGKYNGAVELGGKLAKSKQVQQCVATHWFRFSFGRSETDDDGCALRPIVDKFVSSGGDAKQLLRAIATSEAMRFRQAN